MSDYAELYMLNGIEVSSQEISDQLFSSAIFYGTGCFETMRFQRDQLLRYQDHINRLHRGLDFLELPGNLYPGREFLYQKISQLIDVKGLKGDQAKIRVQCSLLEQNGYRSDPNVQLLTHIRISKYSPGFHPVRLFTAKTRVIPSDCRPTDLKLSNMLHYRAAYREAVNQNYDDALMLSIDGDIAETSMANIFWAIGNKVYTPAIDCSILPGIMRGATIDSIKRSEKMNVEEGLFKPDTLFSADLVWLSNSVIEFLPVISIDGNQLKYDQSLLGEIYSAFQST